MSFLAVLFVLVFFLPTILAVALRRRSIIRIFLLNIFLGVLGPCWFVALYYALRPRRTPRPHQRAHVAEALPSMNDWFLFKAVQSRGYFYETQHPSIPPRHLSEQ